jgi:glutaminyl-peptide cyclotransferase
MSKRSSSRLPGNHRRFSAALPRLLSLPTLCRASSTGSSRGWPILVLTGASWVACITGCGGAARALPEPSKDQCMVDADCRDGFCDRTGQCGTVDLAATGRFGTVCTVPPRDPAGLADGKQSTCGPYPCVEGRCRSCLADAECLTEFGAPTCGHVLESSRWPGNSCGDYENLPAAAPIRRARSVTASNTVARLAVEVVKTYPHSTAAYTEGLVFHEGALWESTGNLGSSQLQRLALETGEASATVALGADLFGEGLARHGDRLVQLTLSSGRALLWEPASLKQIGELPYQGEGWGLCHDGAHFVMSDGTNSLQIRDSDTFDIVNTVEVRLNAATQFSSLRLNELECVDGNVFANVLEFRELVRIAPSSGEITAIIDTRNLLLHPDVEPETREKALDLNGIAYLPQTGHFLLTGKYWPRVFEVRLVEDQLFR